MTIELKGEKSDCGRYYKAFYRINGGDWVRVTGAPETEEKAHRIAAYAAAAAV